MQLTSTLRFQRRIPLGLYLTGSPCSLEAVQLKVDKKIKLVDDRLLRSFFSQQLSFYLDYPSQSNCFTKGGQLDRAQLSRHWCDEDSRLSQQRQWLNEDWFKREHSRELLCGDHHLSWFTVQLYKNENKDPMDITTKDMDLFIEDSICVIEKKKVSVSVLYRDDEGGKENKVHHHTTSFVEMLKYNHSSYYEM
jgi:hypothetical protein